jgi:hypothetical protein
MALGSASTPDPAISPARKTLAVTTDSPVADDVVPEGVSSGVSISKQSNGLVGPGPIDSASSRLF